MVNLTTKYETESGDTVFLYTLNGAYSDRPVVGEILRATGEIDLVRWTLDGECGVDMDKLVEVPIWKPKPEFMAVIRPGWIGCDENDTWWWYKDVPDKVEGGWRPSGPLMNLYGVYSELLPPINEETKDRLFRVG